MSGIPREWDALDVPESFCLPPAPPLYAGPRYRRPCWSWGRGGFACTRPQGHTGRHAASGAKQILAVWEDRA